MVTLTSDLNLNTYTVQLFDTTGRNRPISFNTANNRIDLQAFPSGLHLLVLHNQEGTVFSPKIIKQ